MSNTRNCIVLVGMPGAGKSTLGVVLAKILNKDLVDADLVVNVDDLSITAAARKVAAVVAP